MNANSKPLRSFISSRVSVELLILIIAWLFITECDNSETNKKLESKVIDGTESIDKITVSNQYRDYQPKLLPEAILNRKINNRMKIDNQGYIYGSISKTSYSPGKAVRWKIDSTDAITGPVFLGELPNPYSNADQTIVNANASGTAVGYANQEKHLRIGIIFLNDKLKKLPEPTPSHAGYAAYDINDEGVIAGQAYILENDNGKSYAIAWFPPYDKAPLILPRVDDYSLNAARSINNEGVVTGFLRGSEREDIGVKWSLDSQGNVLDGPAIIHNSEGLVAVDANESLDLVGYGGSDTRSKVYRSDLQRSIYLSNPDDKLRGFALCINQRANNGNVEIVGISDIALMHATSALYWKVSARGIVTGPNELELPKNINRDPPYKQLSFISSGAYSINDLGWIVGWSKTNEGTMIGTLWQPNPDLSPDMSDFQSFMDQ